MHSSIQVFNPNLYSGLWYEVAKSLPPIIWQQNCVRSTAFYQWDDIKNILNITNTCYLSNGDKYQNNGKAKLIPNSEIGFIVKFDINNIESEYWILYTDYDQYAIVTGPNYENIWVLSRNSKLSTLQKQDIQNILTQLNIKLKKIAWTI